MKIAAFFFLLVGLSSFAADAGVSDESGSGLKSCPGKITPQQGQTLAAMVVMMVHKQQMLKEANVENSLGNHCLLEQTFVVLRTVAGYKQCDVENIAKIMSDNLDMDNETKEMLKEALVSGDPEQATSIEIDMVIILRVVCTSLDKIASTDGFSLAVMINGVLPDMTISLGHHLAAVTHTLGSLLGVVFGVVYQAGQIVYMVTDTAGEILSEIVCPPEVISHLTGLRMLDSVFGDLPGGKIGSLRTGLNGGSLGDLLYH